MVEGHHASWATVWLFPKGAKTCVIVKPQSLDSAKKIFKGSGIQVTAHGQHHLGAAIGSRCFAEEYVAEKVQLWSEEICTLSSFAQTHPHRAYSAFTQYYGEQLDD